MKNKKADRATDEFCRVVRKVTKTNCTSCNKTCPYYIDHYDFPDMMYAEGDITYQPKYVYDSIRYVLFENKEEVKARRAKEGWEFITEHSVIVNSEYLYLDRKAKGNILTYRIFFKRPINYPLIGDRALNDTI